MIKVLDMTGTFMRHSFAVILLLSTIVFTSPASADTVFLVQLGSFDTPDMSDKAWQEYSDKYPSLLKELTHMSSRIVLPPSNNEVFRLQAGPIISRVDAKKICKQLRKDEADCFIVETAMFVGEEINSQEIATKTEDTVETETPVKKSSGNVGSFLSGAGNVFGGIANAITAPFSASSVADKAATTAAITGKAVENVVDATTKVASNVAIAADDDEVLPWLRRGNEKSRIFRRAIPAEAQIAETKTKAKTKVKAEVEVEPVDAETDVSKRVADLLEVEETLQPPKAAVITPEVKANTQAVIARTSPARTRLKSEVIMQQLPDTKMVQKETAEIAEQVRKAVVTKAPVSDAYIPPATGTGADSVKVAEAIAVPLSDATSVARGRGLDTLENAELPIFKGTNKIAGFRGNAASSKYMNKKLWVKLNYFADKSEANLYWQQMKRNYSSITANLDMRLMTPYAKRGKASNRITMQLGPFTSYRNVQQLCKAITKPGVICHIQRDGSVNSEGQDGSKTSTKFANSQTASTSVTNKALQNKANKPSIFWVQTGSYRNRGDAMRVWNELKSRHGSLKTFHPHLAHEALTKGEAQVYRLRTGPFATRIKAQELCKGLSSAETPCTVISE